MHDPCERPRERVPIDKRLGVELSGTRLSVSKNKALIDDVASRSICEEAHAYCSAMLINDSIWHFQKFYFCDKFGMKRVSLGRICLRFR